MRNAECQGKRRGAARPPIAIPHSAFRIPHSVLIRHLYGHPILRDYSLLEHLTRLLHQLVRTNRIPRRDVTENEAPGIGGQSDLSRLTRRRMPRLLSALLLLLPKRRLVDEQVRPLRRIHYGSTGSRVAREHDHAPGPLRAYDPLGAHLPPVRQLDGLALLQLPPQGPLRHARRARLLGIKPPRPLMLPERISHGSSTVFSNEHVNVVRFPFPVSPFPDFLPWLHLNDVDLERNS